VDLFYFILFYKTKKQKKKKKKKERKASLFGRVVERTPEKWRWYVQGRGFSRPAWQR
jgi:hypothetical protein